MITLITILIWITIAIIGAIAIIAVKLHYKGNELEHEEGSILPSSESITEVLTIGKEKLKSNAKPSSENTQHSLSPASQDNHSLFRKNITSSSTNDDYISPQTDNNKLNNIEYESENQVLVNYDNTVKKFQEPIKQSQMDIMTQNNKNDDTTELKDLFTIDELIKESKRKDSEREKESQKIKKQEDTELSEIKESIKNKTPEPLIEEVISDDKKEEKEIESPQSLASQKDIDDAITTASQESEKEIESISEDKNITDVLLNQDTKEISEPTLKTPNKIDDNKDYKLGASIDDANLFGDDEDEGMDLDYRKDLDKVKNKITGSKLFQEVKDKLTTENEEIPELDEKHEDFIRSVSEYDYDEFAPIVNETHVDIDADYEAYHDERLRQENTRKIFNKSPEVAKPKTNEIKTKPARDNIKLTLNNNEVVLKKGDEIIFNHAGETYSSQVYAINGDEISVRYRRKDIKIKASDVKKIY